MKGMGHFAERTLYRKIDIKNSELGELKKAVFCYRLIYASSLLAYCILSRDIMPKGTLTSFGGPF